MKSMLKVLSLAHFCLGCMGTAFGNPIEPGVYEGLMLARSPQVRLVGHYLEVQGEKPSKAWAFFLAGRMQAANSTVVAWSNTVLTGTIRLTQTGSLANDTARSRS
ncbi:MAG: hypothetical protein NVS3B5_23980 [Sphingomicrobium sp.]